MGHAFNLSHVLEQPSHHRMCKTVQSYAPALELLNQVDAGVIVHGWGDEIARWTDSTFLTTRSAVR